jgi:hypothetical protein
MTTGTEHNVLARLLPFYMAVRTTDKGWKMITGFTFSAIFNALYLGILAAGVTLGIKVAL